MSDKEQGGCWHMGWNYRVGGKNEGSKSERRDSDRKDEISGWNRQTDREEETEGGDRLMERGSKADWSWWQRKGAGWEWWRWIERGGQLGVWTSQAGASKETGGVRGRQWCTPLSSLHKGHWLHGGPAAFSITHQASRSATSSTSSHG